MTHSDPHSHYSHYYQTPVVSDGVSYRRSPSAHPRDRTVSPANRPSSTVPQRRAAPPRRHPPQGISARKRRKKVQWRPRSRKMLLAGGSMLALTALIAGPKPGDNTPVVVSDVCQQTVQSQSVLSRAELSQLLSVPERSPKTSVQQVIDTPYCILSPVEIREGAIAERDAYPLEFDPQTWLIILYEEDEYAGYDFSFRRE